MVPRSRIVLFVSLGAALALVVSTGAVTWDPNGPVDALDDSGPLSDVKLQPTSNYAYLDDSNETVIDISSSNPNLIADGLNPDSVFTFDDVTALHYDGDEHARVWVTTDVEGVTVQVDGETIDSLNNSIRLNATETVGLDLIVNTSDRDTISGTHTLTIHTRLPDQDNSVQSGGGSSAASEGPLTITVLTPEPGIREIQIENMDDGDQIAVDNLTLELTNDTVMVDALETTAPDDGDAQVVLARETQIPESTIKAEAGVTPLGAFTVDQESGPEFDSVSIRGNVSTADVPPGTVWSELQVLRADNGAWTPISTNRDSQGNTTQPFEATLESFGEFVVAAPIPDISVTSATVDNTTVPVGTNVTVDANVLNNGTAEGNQTIPIRVENETVHQANVTVQPTETVGITTQLQLTEPGTVTIAVGSEVAGEVTVVNQSDADEGPSETTTPENGSADIEPVTSGANDEPGVEMVGVEGTGPNLVEEPAAISLSRLLGLALSIAIGISLITLVRRVSL